MVALPPLQPRVLSADLGGGHDVAGRVQFGEAESLADRAGVRLSYQTRTLNAWARLALLNEFKGRSRTTVSTLAGGHAVDFSSSVHGRTSALTAGLDAQLSQSVSLYGAASDRRALRDSRGFGWPGRLARVRRRIYRPVGDAVRQGAPRLRVLRCC